jgi:hypothetical protein
MESITIKIIYFNTKTHKIIFIFRIVYVIRINNQEISKIFIQRFCQKPILFLPKSFFLSHLRN